MAKQENGTARKQRAPRAGAITNARKHQEEMRTLWEKNRRPRPDFEPIDGQKMASDAAALFKFTGDPIFRAVGEVLRSYGLGQGGPKRSLQRLWEQSDIRWERAPAVVDLWLEENRKDGAGTLSETAACMRAVARLGLPAQSFDAAVQMLRARVRQARKQGHVQLREGDTGRRLFVRPCNPRPDERVPEDGWEVADDTHWRQRFYRGEITARVLVANSPPKKNNT